MTTTVDVSAAAWRRRHSALSTELATARKENLVLREALDEINAEVGELLHKDPSGLAANLMSRLRTYRGVIHEHKRILAAAGERPVINVRGHIDPAALASRAVALREPFPELFALLFAPDAGKLHVVDNEIRKVYPNYRRGSAGGESDG